ncbi:MAG: hypothetical protein J7545_09380 [Roseofilum sp. SBFL]|uniref:hypothetical protein n=1 Tax=unclassified Roseofilum TaxID=2620099 RepID=UPI001B097585|nr:MULTISPECIES: hypothetical protein [unclassified Roseofilum]MBP0014641.1 hypothetical protein [Roseofilum sp. SID3]MBP0024760.1 hypothetical protein [Roseofilum sp. SID2]MBP0036490.1 hypothetical protein [Roseofilum sp. SID1]MBP0042171.1 hypothetical protein [Roseofilum sp. SBFL]
MTQSPLCQYLSQWAKLEPQRCRQRNSRSFELIYQGDWYSVADYPGSHGMIIVAVLDSCQKRQMSCSFEYVPQSLDTPDKVQISCQSDRVIQHQDPEILTKIPEFLLEQYLIALKENKTVAQCS